MRSFSLHRDNKVPMKRQLYQIFREQILNGSMAAGEELPSTREMAEQLQVSRNTVSEAYDMLITEGYVLSRQGASTRVAAGLYIQKQPQQSIVPTVKQHQPIQVDFHTGRPDLDSFPYYLWRQLLCKAADELPKEQLGYTSPKGLLSLRTEIASWLVRSKGLLVDPQDIFITTGATQAINLVVGLLALPGKKVVLEDPCNKGLMETFLTAGCELLPIPADRQGLRTELLEDVESQAVYVTPSHQFPLGGILPAGRRAELIRYARDQNIYLLEDDYDSEFRYTGEPVSPLYAMDSQQVIYIGTFSKVLFPAIRIGYVLLPKKLHVRWMNQRMHLDVQNPPFEQAALAEFLKTRKFDHHIRRMRKLYGERRAALLTTLKEVFGDTWCVWGDNAGLHLAVEFEGLTFDDDFFKRCCQAGLRVASVEQHSICKGLHQNKLLLGYGHLEPSKIREGIQLLYNLIHNP